MNRNQAFINSKIWINSSNENYSGVQPTEQNGRFVSTEILERLIKEGKAYSVQKESINCEPVVKYWFKTTL